MASQALLPHRLCLTQFLQQSPCVSGKMDSVKQQMWFMVNSSYSEEVRCRRMNLWQIREKEKRESERERDGGSNAYKKRSYSFAWMKLFISFQVVIMSSHETTLCLSLGWMLAPLWLVGNLHDLSPSGAWFRSQRAWGVCTDAARSKRGKGKNRCEEEESRQRNSSQWQAWITDFNSGAMKMIWGGLSCKETAIGMAMKICRDDMFCLRIHQTSLVRWKASVIHSVR